VSRCSGFHRPPPAMEHISESVDQRLLVRPGTSRSRWPALGPRTLLHPFDASRPKLQDCIGYAAVRAFLTKEFPRPDVVVRHRDSILSPLLLLRLMPLSFPSPLLLLPPWPPVGTAVVLFLILHNSKALRGSSTASYVSPSASVSSLPWSCCFLGGSYGLITDPSATQPRPRPQPRSRRKGWEQRGLESRGRYVTCRQRVPATGGKA
jgi:hypothetical protein